MPFQVETECISCKCQEQLIVLERNLNCGNCGKEVAILFEREIEAYEKATNESES